VNEGLGAEPGQEILIADDVQATANQIVALLRDAQLRAQIGQNGLQFVRRKYRWDYVVERMRLIEENLTARQVA
jgi:glycosyltransferase involved in cell wall biosynthesis